MKSILYIIILSVIAPLFIACSEDLNLCAQQNTVVETDYSCDDVILQERNPSLPDVITGQPSFDEELTSLEKRLKSLVNNHQELIEISEKLEEVFSPILFINIFCVIAAMCTTCFLSVVKSDDLSFSIASTKSFFSDQY